MKKLLLLLTILVNLVAFSQDQLGGTPVEAIIPIKRVENFVKDETIKSNQLKTTEATTLAPSSPTGSSTEVGVTEGQLSVSLTGGATYSIPIAVPPGINGIVPQIALSYNSQGGNGLAGYGWDISGISVITKIPSTKFHDNTIDGVDFDTLDRFALDGQRLIVKNGTNAVYGANGTVYETEGFSNLKITSYGTHQRGATYGPGYFIVEYPDGSIAHYGNSISSASITDWAITYWQNPQGVRISYNYFYSGNSLAVNTIKYGTTFTNAPINEIAFIYKTRQRIEQAYINGQNLVRDIILSEIKVKGNTVGFRNYLLSHETTSLGYERLKSITEKSGDNSKSFNPTVFNYENTNENINFIPNGTTINVNNVRADNTATVSGDFDGDGKMDFLLYPTNGSDAKKKYWLYTNITSNSLNTGFQHNIGDFQEIFPISWLGGGASLGYKLMPQQGWCVIKTNSATNTTSFTNYSTGTVSPIYFQDLKEYQFPKFTYGYWKDPCINGNNPYIGINETGDNSTLKEELTEMNDIESIALRPPVDIIIDPNDPTEPVWVEIVRDVPKVFLNGDFNGDGLTDVIVVEKAISYSVTNGCSSYAQTTQAGRSYFVNLDRRLTTNFVTNAGYIQSTNDSKFIVADFNGDGKSDIFVFNSGVLRVYTLNDNNFLSLISSTNHPNISLTYPIYMGDYNGDGKADFITPTENRSSIFAKFLSTGTSLISNVYDLGIGQYTEGFYDGNKSSIQHIIPNDFNNDGKTDLILTKCHYVYSGNVDFVQQNRFISVRYLHSKGNNQFESIMYTLMTDVYGLNHFPIPVSLSFDKANANKQISFISNNNVYSAISLKDNVIDTSLKEIVLGSGVKQVISYQSLDNDNYSYENVFQPSTYTDNYPNFDIKVSSNFKVVSMLEEVSAKQYKKQKFKYYGAVTNVEGLGFLGFRGLARTNWFNDDNPIISSVSKHDITKRGAVSETYTALGESYGNFTSYTPSNFITKTNMTYVDQLLGNKVFKINNSSTILTNGLDGTSSETTTTYDVYNNPLTTTTFSKNGTVIENTEVINIEYFPISSSPIYILGRVKKKNSSVSHNGDTMTGEEIYTYNASHLVSKIEKKGHNTNYLTEENVYDVYGNITQKKITAVGLAPRITNFTYDSSGRFMLSSADVEELVTSYTYNANNGLLLTQTLPSNAGYPLITSYFYDDWGKKIKETDYLGKSLNYFYSWLAPGVNGFLATRVAGDDNSESYIWYDDLGRKIAEGFRAINEAGSSESPNSWKTYEFDIYDRIKKTYEPHFSSFPKWEGLYSTSSFDNYGRITQTVEPTGKTSNINYSGLTVSTSDGVSNTIAVKNSIGNLISMTDNGGTIQYQYYADGNLKQSNFNGVIVSIEQDGWGRKTRLVDPSAGTYEYEYNEFGEITKEITPKGETTYSLDSYGKVLNKTIIGTSGDPTNTKTIYTYHPDTKLLISTRYEDFTGGFHTIYAYGYDNYKRLNFNDESGFNAYYQRAIQFDAYGKPERELYTAINTADLKRSDKWIRNTYKFGHHWQILDDATNQVLWETQKVNAKGQLLNGNYGNGIVITNTYDQYGFPTQFKHNKSATENIMTLNTSFESQRGNLTNRYNSMFDHSEDFTYDNLDRLNSWSDNKEIQNFIFTNSTDAFLPTNVGVAVSNSTNTYYSRLSVTTNVNFEGTQRVVKTNALVGEIIDIKGQLYFRNLVGSGNYIKYSVVERNPATGQIVETQYGINSGTNFTFQHTVSQYSEIIIKVVAGNDLNFQDPITFSLDNIKVVEIKTQSQTYDNLGRINQNNVGTYNYTNIDPVTSVPKHFQNSSIQTNSEYSNYYLSRANLDITYNAFKSPINIIEEGKDKLSFIYNLNNSRSTMYYGSLEADKLARRFRKHYATDGSMEIKQDIVNGTVEFITYIGGDAYSAPIILKSDGTTQEYLYLHRDYLGSIVAITNQSASVVEKRLFDAWGNIIRVQDGVGNNLNTLTVIDRGYTGHEHLQAVNLIHMNGRLYDPIIHRFLQPDNFVSDTQNTQAFNRYSYVLNNPLKYSDASGELPVLVAAAIIGAFVGGASYLAHAIQTGNWSWSGFGVALGVGAVVGAIAPQAIFSAGSIGELVISSFASGFMPAINIPINDHITLSASPSIAFGNAGGAGVSFGVTFSDGNFSISGGYGIMEYSNYNGFGANSREIRYSALVSYDDGKTGFSLGTNIWRGDYKQQTGTLGIHSGDFRALYENDGKPFSRWSGDGHDQYRTAALNLSVKDVSLGFNLFTGERTRKDYDIEKELPGGELGFSSTGKYGEHYKNGLVNERGTKYRLGALTVGYKGYNAGINSEWVRHAIQNVAIHGTWIAMQRMFEMQSGNVNGYFQYRTPNQSTTW